MEIYLPEEFAEDVISISESLGVQARVIGRVEASSTEKVSIRGEHGSFEYT